VYDCLNENWVLIEVGEEKVEVLQNLDLDQTRFEENHDLVPLDGGGKANNLDPLVQVQNLSHSLLHLPHFPPPDPLFLLLKKSLPPFSSSFDDGDSSIPSEYHVRG